MNDSLNSSMPEPRKVGVWAEGTHIEANADRKDTETVSALAEVGGGISGAVDGIEAALEVLKSYIPQVEPDVADTVWTVDSLLTQLADDIES